MGVDDEFDCRHVWDGAAVTVGALSGKHAIVTGAASGLGRAIALRFARTGAFVALCDRDAEGLEETAATIRAAGGSVFTDVFDLVDTKAILAFAEAAGAAMGGIDIVCNNAALAIRNPIELQDEEGWDFVQQVNLKSVFFMVKSALPFLRASKGNVVNISSMAGSFGIAGRFAPIQPGRYKRRTNRVRDEQSRQRRLIAEITPPTSPWSLSQPVGDFYRLLSA